MQVGGEFAGTDSADPLHEPRTLVITVDVDYVIDALRVSAQRAQFKINEVHMVAENHVGGLEAFHVDSLYLVFDACGHDFGEKPDKPCEKEGLTNGILSGLVKLGMFVVDVLIHKKLLCVVKRGVKGHI